MNIDHCLNALCTIQKRTVTYNATTRQQTETWANEEITITGEVIGTGTGANSVFYTGLKAVSSVDKVFIDGVLKTVTTDYAVTVLNDTGNPATITFTAAPALGSSVTCDYKHKDSSQIRCRLDMASGGEKRVPKKIYERATHLMLMGYRTGLDYKDYRIISGGVTYNILMVTPAGGTTTHLELMLELVD